MLFYPFVVIIFSPHTYAHFSSILRNIVLSCDFLYNCFSFIIFLLKLFLPNVLLFKYIFFHMWALVNFLYNTFCFWAQILSNNSVCFLFKYFVNLFSSRRSPFRFVPINIFFSNISLLFFSFAAVVSFLWYFFNLLIFLSLHFFLK